MNIDREATNDPIESDAPEEAQINDSMSQTTINPPDPSTKRRRRFDKTKPLNSPEDEAIAQYLATPKSIREFKSFSELATHFNISRMTVYRRSKDANVLERVEWLLTHHKLAGDLIARLNWERIVAGQVRAAVAGNTKAAIFCKENAWPEYEPGPFELFRK
jgi:hypothetical protein